MNRTEALRIALGHVYSGAEHIDAECVEDHLADLGFEVVQMPAARAAAKRRHQPTLPLAVTRRLPKGRTA